MSKKTKKNKTRVRCLGCDSKMGKKDVACRRCATVRAGTFRPGPDASKTVFVPAGPGPAFVAKTARPRLAVAKNASDQRRDDLMNELYRSHDVVGVAG